jgi:hypothetical protein
VPHAVPPPQEGLTIAEAMKVFASNPAKGEKWYFAFLRWRDGVHCTTDDDWDQVRDCWTEPEHDLQAKLISGKVSLSGYDAKECRHIRPDKEWFEDAKLNPTDDSAESSTLRLQNVRVFLAEETEKQDEPPTAARRQSAPAVIRAFDAWVKTRGKGNEPKKREAEAWAKEHNYSTDVVRKLHTVLGARERGRPKKNGQK